MNLNMVNLKNIDFSKGNRVNNVSDTAKTMMGKRTSSGIGNISVSLSISKDSRNMLEQMKMRNMLRQVNEGIIQEEKTLFEQVNEKRLKEGLKPLQRKSLLTCF